MMKLNNVVLTHTHTHILPRSFLPALDGHPVPRRVPFILSQSSRCASEHKLLLFVAGIHHCEMQLHFLLYSNLIRWPRLFTNWEMTAYVRVATAAAAVAASAERCPKMAHIVLLLLSPAHFASSPFSHLHI